MSKECVVFISSTSEDLKEYRQAARDAAIEAGFRPVMMEYFAASGNPALPECLGKVTPCDVLVVIVAHRYGWVPPDQPGGQTKSITWLECEHAESTGKKVLAFLVDKRVKWPLELEEAYRSTAAIKAGKCTPELIVEVQRNVACLNDFKQWIDKGRTRATFRNADDLRAKVLSALHQWRGGVQPPPPSDPRDYLKWLRDETATIDIRGLGVGSGKAHSFPIEDLYVPLTTVAETRRGKDHDPAGRKPVGLQEALEHRRLVIVGDPGSGKTTFLKRIAYALCQPLPKTVPHLLKHLPDHPLPVLISIAKLAEHVRKCLRRDQHDGPTTEDAPGWLADFLSAQNKEQNWQLDGEFFPRKLGDGTAILLLDGLDEASDRLERERMARLFEAATKAYRKCRFVVTTRPQSYEGLSLLKDFKEARIEPLEPQAIETFLEHWCRGLYRRSRRKATSHQQELSKALHASPEILRMARNPVMLTALAVVHWNEKRLPERRAELYESILTWLSRSREKRPGRQPAESCLALLQELALAVQDAPEGRQVRVTIDWAAAKLAPEFQRTPERKRLSRAVSLLEQEQVDSGIIVSRGGEIQFWHLTFQEYLAARAIAGLPDAAQYRLLLEDDKVYRPEWRETALLLAGLLGKGKVDGLVSAILDRIGKKPTLAQQARCAGLVGAMVRDLQPFEYEPSDARYSQLLDAVLGIFDAEKSKTVDFKVRLEAAEALGQAGDPRIGRDNLVKVEGKSAWIGRYPVTVEEYKRFVEDEGYRNPLYWKAGEFGRWNEPDWWDDQKQHPNRPVAGVSWYEAAAYCAWKGVRLPTEAEWKRAARGSSGREYPWGKEPPDPTRANYYEGKVGHPTPVGMYPSGATPEGIQDLAGNVWEWVADWYEKGQTRVLRGGSWYFSVRDLRPADRDWSEPGDRSGNIGFRCAR